jgi:hypothetical protein
MARYTELSGVAVCVLCLWILCSATIRTGLYNPGTVLAADTNSTTNATQTKVLGPPQVFESKPTGNYTNATALVTEGPRQIVESKPTGNYTNATALVTEGPRQIITDRSAISVAPKQPGQNVPNSVVNIPDIKITKEQAAKAEQEANVMIKVYNEKLELEKQKEKEAAALAAQSNQTGGEETEEAEDTPAETEIGIEEEEEEESEEEDEEDNNNEDENNEAEDDDE